MSHDDPDRRVSSASAQVSEPSPLPGKTSPQRLAENSVDPPTDRARDRARARRFRGPQESAHPIDPHKVDDSQQALLASKTTTQHGEHGAMKQTTSAPACQGEVSPAVHSKFAWQGELKDHRV